MLALAKRFGGGKLRLLAELTGSAPAHLSQIKNGVRSMGDDVARRFEHKLGLNFGYMDRQHSAAQEESAPYQVGDLSADERTLIESFRALIDVQQAKLLQQAREMENENRHMWEELQKKHRIPSPASDEKVANHLPKPPAYKLPAGTPPERSARKRAVKK